MAVTPQTFNGGGDVVLNSFYGGLVNAFNRNQQRVQAQQQAEAKRLADEQQELSDIVKKVNTNGVQKIDIPDMTSKLNDIYDTYYQANKAQSRDKRIALRMDLERKITEMGNFVTQSKERGVQESKRAEWIGDPRNTGLVANNSLTTFKTFNNTPTSKLPQGAFDISNYSQPDTSYLDKTIDQSAKDLLATADQTLKVGKGLRVGNRQGTVVSDVRNITKEAFATDLFRQYGSDSKFKNITDFTASQMGITPADYLTSVADEYQKLGRLGRSEEKFVANSVPRASNSGSGSSSGAGDLMSLNLPFAEGKGNVGFNDYVPVSIPSKNFAGSQAIDLTTGKPSTEPLPSSGNYSVVGIGNAPFIKPAKGQEKNPLAGALAQPNFAKNNPNNITMKPVVHVKRDEDGVSTDYFLSYDRLPTNVKNSKAIKEAIGKFKPAAQRSTPQPSVQQRQTTTQPKSTGKKKITGF